MISGKITKAINDQINKEIYSAYLYIGMAAYAASMALGGISNWFRAQAKEELGHAEKFMNYLSEQGGELVLKAIAAPDQKFTSVAGLFDKTLDHEKEVTASIHNLVTLAKKEADYATEIFLQWFVTEQIEEEASVSDIIQKLAIGGKGGNAILVLDKALALRK
jgi:ferritin